VSNKHKPHVIVLPEDDANRQIANGFLLDPSIKPRNIQVLNPAGGWGKVLDSFLEDHVAGLRKWPERHLVLLIDFDEHVEARTQQFFSQSARQFSGRPCGRAAEMARTPLGAVDRLR
jgi:hypothetical protein